MKSKHRIIAWLMAVLMLTMVVPSAVYAAAEPTMVMDEDCRDMKVVSGSTVYMDFIINRKYETEMCVAEVYKGRSTAKKDQIGEGVFDIIEDADQLFVTLYFNSSDWGLSAGTICTVKSYIMYWANGEWNEGPSSTTTFEIIKNVCGSNHKYGSTKVKVAATCSTPGSGVVTCSKCGVKKKVEIPKAGHKYGSGRVTREPKCNREGVRTYTCTGCGTTKTEAIPKTKHTYDAGYESIKPTCTTDGQMTYTCTGCGDLKREAIPMRHRWDEGQIIEEPTVSTAGSKNCICLDCKTPGVVTIPAIFSDVHKDWYTDYVQYVYDNTLMTGIKGTTKFQPNANITKAQVAQVLYNMEGQPAITDNAVFTDLKDVPSYEWYASAVAWAYSTGVVTGDTNAKKFFPNADVTREQLAIMMYRYAQFKDYDTSQSSDLAGLKNAENTANWAEDGVKWAVGAGLISGLDKNGVKDLAPQGNASRAQVAAILQRFCAAYDVMVVNAAAGNVVTYTVIPEIPQEEAPETTEEYTEPVEVTEEVIVETPIPVMVRELVRVQ